jgi:DNA-binding SARP family transcriptional activator
VQYDQGRWGDREGGTWSNPASVRRERRFGTSCDQRSGPSFCAPANVVRTTGSGFDRGATRDWSVSGDRVTGTATRKAGCEDPSKPKGPIGDILPRLSSIGPPEVIEGLAAVRVELTDPTLIAILAAAQEMATRWNQEHDRLDRHWLAYEEAFAAEGEARRTLDMLLRTLARLTESSLTAKRPSDHEQADPADAASAGSSGADWPIRVNSQVDTCPPVTAGSVELAVCLLGRFRLFRRGQLVEGWHGPKTPRVVRYLFAHCGRPAPRDVLIDQFWSNVDPETARRSLHQVIYVIRRTLRSPGDPVQLVVFADEAYAVNTAAGVWCDAQEFEAWARAGRRAERELREEDAISAYELAERYYVGEFLEDSPYEDWAGAERDRLRLIYIDVATRLAEHKFAQGDVEAALHFSQRVLLRDSCDEAAHRCALRCYGAAGNRNLVVRQYEACVTALDRAYGLAPTRETTELYASLLGS